MKVTFNQTGCSTFMLHDEENFLIGHNLDESFDVPGMVIFNQRGIPKSSHSLMEWVTGQNPPTPQVTWTSKLRRVSQRQSADCVG
jgi:hypothetical protein